MGNGLTVNLDQGELTIDGVSMHTPAWQVLDLLELWGAPDTRGGSVVLPESPGRHAYPRRVDETVYSLEMLITGAVNISNTPYANPVEGLQLNLDYLRANVVSPPAGATRPATLDMPDGSTRSAAVQVSLDLGAHGGNDVLALLTLTVPLGGFV